MSAAFKCDTCGVYRDGFPNKLPKEFSGPSEHFDWGTGINVRITFTTQCAPLEVCEDCIQRLHVETIDRVHEAFHA